MATITTEEIASKKEELAKKIKQYQEKVEQWSKELEALEIAERLLTGSSESSSDKRRRELGEAVEKVLASSPSLHYKEIAKGVAGVLGRDVSDGAMYNFLVRSIERNDFPLRKGEEAGHFSWVKDGTDGGTTEAATL